MSVQEAGGRTHDVHFLTVNSPDNYPRCSQTCAIRYHGEFMAGSGRVHLKSDQTVSDISNSGKNLNIFLLFASSAALILLDAFWCF